MACEKSDQDLFEFLSSDLQFLILAEILPGYYENGYAGELQAIFEGYGAKTLLDIPKSEFPNLFDILGYLSKDKAEDN